MKISIIIPTLNEADNISLLIPHLLQNARENGNLEIIVSDGGSEDKTVDVAQSFGVKTVLSSKRNRAIQMNKGANMAEGDVLYFLHADTFPPIYFDELILKSIKNGNSSGCFQLTFDWNHPIMRFYGFFTRFGLNIFRGGDQSLFVDRRSFFLMRGFNEELKLMEDYEIINRLEKKGRFEILSDVVTSSAMKYRINGAIQLQWHYFIIQVMYRMGFSQDKLINYFVRYVK